MVFCVYFEGAQDSGIPEIPEIIMGLFFSQRISEKPGHIMGFFHQGLSFFEVDNFDILCI